MPSSTLVLIYTLQDYESQRFLMNCGMNPYSHGLPVIDNVDMELPSGENVQFTAEFHVNEQDIPGGVGTISNPYITLTLDMDRTLTDAERSYIDEHHPNGWTNMMMCAGDVHRDANYVWDDTEYTEH